MMLNDLEIPVTPACRAALEVATAYCSSALLNHSVRAYQWAAFSFPERATHVFDWQRLRNDGLEPLLANRIARWYPFDFAAGLRPDGTYALSTHSVERQPAPVIMLDGAYSASPHIADLVDLAVLMDSLCALCRHRTHSPEDFPLQVCQTSAIPQARCNRCTAQVRRLIEPVQTYARVAEPVQPMVQAAESVAA